MKEFLLSCAPGLEGLLQDELSEILGIPPESMFPGHGVVAFPAEPKQLAHVVAYTRIGSRLLMPLKTFSAASLDMIYDQVRRINWPEVFDNTQTFAVFSHGLLGVEGIAASILPLKIKDAICDEFRKKGFDRPDVDRHEPKVRVEAHFTLRKCQLSIDLCGRPLHRRGYRLDGAEAPLREDKAAALVAFSKLKAAHPVVDAFCGSGTLAIEAALKLSGAVSPVLRHLPLREMLLTRYFPETLDVLKDLSFKKPSVPKNLTILAYDIDAKVLRLARDNAERAGVASLIHFEQKDACTLTGENLQIIGNPPYGERLGEQRKSVELISALSRQLKHHVVPCELNLVIPQGELEKAVGFKPSRKLAFENANLPSRLLHFAIFAGKRTPKS